MAHLGRCTLFVGCFHYKGGGRGAHRHSSNIPPPQILVVHRGYSYKERGIPSSLGLLSRILHFSMKLTFVPARHPFSSLRGFLSNNLPPVHHRFPPTKIPPQLSTSSLVALLIRLCVSFRYRRPSLLTRSSDVTLVFFLALQ